MSKTNYQNTRALLTYRNFRVGVFLVYPVYGTGKRM